MLLSGAVLVGYETLLSRYEGSVGKADLFGDKAAGAQERKSDIKGPLNILLVGIDPRDAKTAAAGRLDHGAARARVAGPGVHLLHSARPLRGHPAVRQGRLPGRHRQDQRRDVVRQPIVDGQEPERAAGLRTAGQDGAARRPGSSSSTPARSSTSPASRRSSTRWAASTCTSTRTSSPSTCSRTASHRDAGNPTTASGLHRAAGGLQEGHQHLSGWQALDYVRQRYGPARTATTTGSGTSSSSSRRWSTRRSARTW